MLDGVTQWLEKTEWEWHRENSGFQLLGNRAHIYFYVYLAAINPGHSTVPGAEQWKLSRTDNYCYLYTKIPPTKGQVSQLPPVPHTRLQPGPLGLKQ